MNAVNTGPKPSAPAIVLKLAPGEKILTTRVYLQEQPEEEETADVGEAEGDYNEDDRNLGDRDDPASDEFMATEGGGEFGPPQNGDDIPASMQLPTLLALEESGFLPGEIEALTESHFDSDQKQKSKSKSKSN